MARRRKRKRRNRRWARRGVGIGGALIIGYGAFNFLDVWWTARHNFEGTADAAVVLGAAQYNGRPSPVLRGRLDHAAELYFEGRVPVVVLTGGSQAGDVTTEAKAGYDYLRHEAGIPDEDLLLEVDGTSTYESLRATARFLDNRGIESVILVTDPYHARRSQLVADEVGLDAQVSSTSLDSSFGQLVKESAAVSVGRIVGFRRLDDRGH